jgi:DNA-binding response OmpR family regulator
MSDPVRPTWIALADGGPLAELAADPSAERLRVVSDAETFASLLRAGRPTVAILDAPPARRADLDLALGERRRRPSLRLVHLSRPRAVAERLEALRLGVDEALPRSIAATELAARIAVLEARSRAKGPSTIVVADGVVLDPVAHEVRRDGAVVHLRPKEYQLLAMLASHPGHAYTRRQLLDRVWGPGHDGDPRTIDVHVRWLRAKLEARPDTPMHLITVRGVGYRLDPSPP